MQHISILNHFYLQKRKKIQFGILIRNCHVCNHRLIGEAEEEKSFSH